LLIVTIRNTRTSWIVECGGVSQIHLKGFNLTLDKLIELCAAIDGVDEIHFEGFA